MPYSAAMIREMQAQESSGVSVLLMEMFHSSFGTEFFVRDGEGLTHNGQFYRPFPFSVKMPEQSSEGPIPIISLTVQNVSREIIQLFRGISNREAVEVRLFEVLRSEPEYQQRSFPMMKLRNIEYTDEAIRGDIVLTPILEMSVSRSKFTPSNFAGLF